MANLDDRDVQKIVEKQIEEVFGAFSDVNRDLREKYNQPYGLIRRLFTYIQELEGRINDLESRLDDAD